MSWDLVRNGDCFLLEMRSSWQENLCGKPGKSSWLTMECMGSVECWNSGQGIMMYPQWSTHRHATAMEISYWSLQRILHLDLNLQWRRRKSLRGKKKKNTVNQFIPYSPRTHIFRFKKFLIYQRQESIIPHDSRSHF